MNIQEALKETEVVTPDYINNENESHAKLFDGILYWYSIKRNEYFLPVTLQGINNINWQPYHPKEEIRPKEAGELWESENGTKFFTICQDEQRMILRARCERDSSWESNGGTMSGMIHNQNGWKRLFPTVPEENEIVIEGVEWENDGQVVYTYTNEQVFDWETLTGKPPMTMKLIPKEKGNE